MAAARHESEVGCAWARCTPSVPGAVGIIALHGDVDEALRALGIAPVRVGGVVLRSLAGVDEGLVARWSERYAQLMPHGGAAVMRRLIDALERSGVHEAKGVPAREAYPEASDEIEARMLDALARAASPLAIDLLLDQPRRWREVKAGRLGVVDEATNATLGRLIDPPLVAALGPANIGKSTLVNALAGRAVSIVADEPGTTRDHVGVRLDLGGLVVRYVDTPGIREAADEIEAQARRAALCVVARADLVLLMGDAGSPTIGEEQAREMVRDAGGLGEGPGAFARVALRTDLGAPSWDAEARVSATRGEGLAELVALVRENLVPEATRRSPLAWRFWRDEGTYAVREGRT